MSTVRRTRLVRAGIALGIAVLAYLAAGAAGVLDYLDPTDLAERIRGTGAAGVLVFFAAFGVGEVTQLPATAFFTTAVGVWGLPAGAAISVAGAISACTFAFALVRLSGRWILEGRSLEALRRYAPYIETAPLRATIVLRLLIGAAPPVNWALALSTIGWRDFLVGTAIGMTPNVLAYAWLLDQLVFTSRPVLPAWFVIVLLLAVASLAALLHRRLSRRGRRGP